MNTRVQALFESFNKESDRLRQAFIIEKLRKEEDIPVKEIAQKIKKHSTHVSHLLRVVKLPEIVIDGYYSNQISFAHLIILSRLDVHDQIVDAYEAILTKSLSTAQTEILIRRMKHKTETVGSLLSSNICDQLIAQAKKQYPGIQVHIYQSQIRGKIILEYRGEAEKSSEFIQEMLRRITGNTQKGEVLQPQELMILE